MVLKNLKDRAKRQYRHGSRFKRHYRMMSQSYRHDLETLRQQQIQELRNLLHFCQRQVPYYTHLFEDFGLNFNQMDSLDGLQLLPIIDKYDVKNSWKRFKAKSILAPLYVKSYTSGTTGTPVTFLRDYNSINFENAAIWSYWHQSGDSSFRRVTLRGEVVVSTEQTEPPFWKYNQANHELVMSSYHLSGHNADAYIQKILDFQPKVLYCYPSMGALLAKFFREKQIDYQFQAIFTSSEALSSQDMVLMEETFQSKVFDWYGQAERVAAIFRCVSGHYHIHEAYSLVELIPSDDHPGLFEIVGTQLHNRAMPLIRYRTHDLVEMADDDFACDCGSHFRVVKTLIGRKPNYIVTPSGAHIGNAPSNILKGFDEFIEAQFYQANPNSLTLYVVPTVNYTEKTRLRLVERMKHFTSPDMALNVVETDRIERGPNGKFISLISEVSVP